LVSRGSRHRADETPDQVGSLPCRACRRVAHQPHQSLAQSPQCQPAAGHPPWWCGRRSDRGLRPACRWGRPQTGAAPPAQRRCPRLQSRHIRAGHAQRNAAVKTQVRRARGQAHGQAGGRHARSVSMHTRHPAPAPTCGSLGHVHTQGGGHVGGQHAARHRVQRHRHVVCGAQTQNACSWSSESGMCGLQARESTNMQGWLRQHICLTYPGRCRSARRCRPG